MGVSIFFFFYSFLLHLEAGQGMAGVVMCWFGNGLLDLGECYFKKSKDLLDMMIRLTMCCSIRRCK